MKDEWRSLRGLTVVIPNRTIWLDVFYLVLGNQTPHALETELDGVGIK